MRDKEIFDPDSPIMAQNNFESEAENPLYISSSESHSQKEKEKLVKNQRLKVKANSLAFNAY